MRSETRIGKTDVNTEGVPTDRNDVGLVHRNFDPMVLSTSPRKAVPLASGDDCDQSSSLSKVPSVTRRAFFCGVVVESEGGNAISEGSSDLQHVAIYPRFDYLLRCSRTRGIFGRSAWFTIRQ